MGNFFLVMNVNLRENVNGMSDVTNRPYTMGKFLVAELLYKSLCMFM